MAIFVLGMGFCFYPYLDRVVDLSQVPQDVNITTVFFLFVANSAASYLFSYKQSLLTADQRNHLVSLYQTCIQLGGYVFKTILLVLTKKFLLTLAVDIAFVVTMNGLFSFWITNQYREVFQVRERLGSVEKTQIFKHTSGLLCHKIGQIVVTSTDNVILSKYVSLAAVGIYSNYALIVSAISNIVGRIIQGLIPSITNYVIQTNKEESRRLLFRILFANLWFSSFTTIALFLLLNPFVGLWLGDKFLFSQGTVALICAQHYFQTARLTANGFINGYGLFHLDKPRALVESAINLTVSIWLVNIIGIPGVFAGTVISGVLTYFWREPYLLNKHALHGIIRKYWVVQLLWFGLTVSLCWVILPMIEGISSTVAGFVLQMGIVSIAPNLIIMILFCRSSEWRYWWRIVCDAIRSVRNGK
jgi:O-antigen/teichoic acid export membrane protein